MSTKHFGRIERWLFLIGLVLIGIFVGAYIHRETGSRAALARFEELKQERKESQQAQRIGPSLADRSFSYDFTLWSPQRVADYKQSLNEKFDEPLAILRIKNLNLEVPVLNGDDDLTLNRAVGYIPGMSRPGEAGNVGIAGHRDGFFRVLKDIKSGSIMELETLDQVYLYKVDRIDIIDKHDASVLQQTTDSRLTLVTCYPFYFIGSAPQRYIVTASLVTSGVPAPAQTTNSARLKTASQTMKAQSQKPIKETTQ